MQVVIGLDVGTTATKAVAAGSDGVVRCSASTAYPLDVPAPGRAELDPQRLQAAAVATLAEVAKQSRALRDEVVGICLSAAMHGLVPMDASGSPSGPLVTWADDRAAAEAAALVADGRARGLHARTGTPVHPMSPLSRLAWWRHQEPAVLASAPRWGGVKELLVAALCGGEHVTDLSSASATGCYDIHRRQWDPEALQIAGVRPDQLPEVLATTAVLPPLRAEIAAATGLATGVPVYIGAADGVLANLGVGAVGAGIGAVSLGTSGALRSTVAEPTVDSSGRLFCYALTGDCWVLGASVNNAGSVVRWAAEAFGGSEVGLAEALPADEVDAMLLEEAAGAPAGSAGLLCLPYLLGERAPWWRPGLRGAYVGLRRDHRRPHLVRAAVEGVCQQLALVREALDEAGQQVTEVRATGGAVGSPLWVNTLASAMDLPVRLAASPEGAGLGASLLGWHASGELADLEEAASLVVLQEATEPDPMAAELYRGMRPLVERSTFALLDVFAALDGVAARSVGGTASAG